MAFKHVSQSWVVVLLVLSFMFFSQERGSCADSTESTAENAPRTEASVLTIGNSFSWSLYTCFPKAVESAGCKLTLENLNIGGCSLERHWNNIAREESEPGYAFFKDYTYKQKITSRKWDFISVQQASHYSWQENSYEPFGAQLVKFVRDNAPESEIVIQQTWSYRPDDGRLAGWKIDQQQMYEKLADAYGKFAARECLRVIPVGTAVQTARQTQSCGYTPFNRADFTYPDLPKMDGFLCGNIKWSSDQKKLEGDAFHLNLRGQYLQACVWFAFIYNRSAEEITWVPGGITPQDAVFLRKTADATVEQYKAVNQSYLDRKTSEQSTVKNVQ